MVLRKLEVVRQLTGRPSRAGPHRTERGGKPVGKKIRLSRTLGPAPCILLLLSLAAPARAAEPFQYNDSGGNTVPFTEFEDRIREGWTAARTISLYAGAAGLAGLALRALLGSEKEMEQLKKAGIWIIAAVFALSVLPAAVQLGTDTGRRYGWTPPGTGISYGDSVTGGSRPTGSQEEDGRDGQQEEPEEAGGYHPSGWG